MSELFTPLGGGTIFVNEPTNIFDSSQALGGTIDISVNQSQHSCGILEGGRVL
jgi:hypothetical protein